MSDHSTTFSIQRLAYFLIVLTLIILILVVAQNLLMPLVFGFFFSLVLLPICHFFERWLKNRVISILLSFLVVLLPIGGLLAFFGYEFVRLVEGLPSIGRQLREGVMQLLDWSQQNLNLGVDEIRAWLSNNLSNLVDTPLEVIASSLSSSTSILLGAAMTAIYTFFFLLYRTAFKNFFIYQFGRKTRPEAQEILQATQKVAQEYLFGMGLVILILGVLNSLGLWIIGIQYFIFWGFLAALLAIIPYIGTTLGGLLPFLYALATTGTLWQPLAVILFYMGVQQLEGNLITPNVVGSSVKINPLAAIFSLFLGGMIWGIAGLILALPAIAIIRIIFSHIPFLQPVSVLLSADLYDLSNIFSEKYNADKFRLVNFFSRKSR